MRRMNYYAAVFILFSGNFLVPELNAFGTESQVTLCAVEEKIESPFYLQLLKLKNESSIEKAKILYLIDLVRRSPHTFIRNGEEHTGEKAARHLKMKYGYAFGRVRTAEEFIDGIASQSSQTGKRYLIRTTDGKARLARDLFYAELNTLNDRLSQSRPAGRRT